ncbi:hypothetical protein CDL15_Pgr012343 [Punica granatum]|uniref:Uncharacterized protein n=1 Tax=Punica granatum TaxID=22663 RepID=A0A218X765_PUNGR|nr:hypothetical protein CDL15_Pgr012343 [Punica granatum]
MEFSVPWSPIAICASQHSFWRTFCPVGDRWLVVLGRGPLAREDLGTFDRDFQCSLNVSRHSGIVVGCSKIVVISVFRGNAPEACRETFVTTETYFGKPSRVSKGCLKLVPRSWWSLSACRPVLRGRLLVSGASPGSSVRKGVHGGIGVSRLKQDAPEMRSDVSLVTLALRGIFGAPYWAPFGASVTQ